MTPAWPKDPPWYRAFQWIVNISIKLDIINSKIDRLAAGVTLSVEERSALNTVEQVVADVKKKAASIDTNPPQQ